jgi:predicted TPR repeat methyltransferase
MDARLVGQASSGDLLADRRYAYAEAAAAEGDYAAAIDLLQQTLERVPNWAPAWYALGKARAALLGPSPQEAVREPALEAFQRCLALEPDDRLGSRLQIARLRGVSDGVAASPAYVASLFDQYAPRFDRHLVETLAYRAPALLREAVGERRDRFESMLDLGCGTGLAGAAFADLASSMTGVDLSAAMLDIARAKGLYDRLVQDEIVAFLAAEPTASADLVIAADVFVYFGDLAPVFAGVDRVMPSGGLFAFTTQAHDGSGYVLGEDLRHAHSRSYLVELAAEFAFDILRLEPASTRRDRGVDLPGLIAVLAKK